MERLEPPDAHHLLAALGWLELSNPTEAGEELLRLSPENIEHPDVLEVRWQICVDTRSWEAGLKVSEKLIQRCPDRSSGYIARAYALRRMPNGGLPTAWDALLPTVKLFPKVEIIPYNLACYAAQMGRLDESWDWLQKAIAVAGRTAEMKRRALADSDLEPIWDRVKTL